MDTTVLIVDDEAHVRETTRIVLAREGYTVLTAESGESAINTMRTNDAAMHVCTLVCDLDMPHMGGIELIEYFRQHFPDIPIIVLSGASDTVFLDGIIRQGVSDWLRKPVTREALLAKVRTATNLFTLRQQRR